MIEQIELLQVDLRHIEGERFNDSALIEPAMELGEYYQNTEWDLMRVTARRHSKNYPCCPYNFYDVTFNITIRRRTVFHSVNLIIPIVAIIACVIRHDNNNFSATLLCQRII